ncbi:unnamed protein product [Callosobruchus maculatus]|uniref:Uncharacterized protein n=1 Tax=Callosobruchus maculatus TaxID=64391 RepID=A0A653DFW3_CALMS|nr:unnamed protein product [Callosobruchus maculatus]
MNTFLEKSVLLCTPHTHNTHTSSLTIVFKEDILPLFSITIKVIV